MHQDELKERLIEALIEYRTTSFKQSRNGKFVDSKIVILEPRLECYVKEMFKKTRNVNFIDFYNDCVFKIIEVIMDKFTPQFGWETLVNRTNKKAYNQLIKCLKNYIKKQALEGYIKDRGYSTTENVKLPNGEVKKRNVYVTTNFSSIDVTKKENDRDVLISDTIQHGFWDAINDDGKANSFLDWFRNNRERILTKSQQEFLLKLEKHGYSLDDKKTEELSKDGVNFKSVSTKLRAIEQRILKKWNVERKFIETSFIERTLTRKISLLQMYLDMFEDNDKIKLSNFIKANIDAPVIEKFLDKLSLAEYKLVVNAIKNKSVINCETLSKFYDYAEEKISSLQVELEKEQQIKEELAKKQGVILKETKEPIYTSSLYLHLDSFGNLYNRTKMGA